MVNKLWYKEVSDSHSYLRNYIKSYIDLYFFDSEKFNKVEDITIENLGEFLEVILGHYQYYHFHLGKLYDIPLF